MNLTVLQIQALSILVRNVETMIEQYWDTENGDRLSQSLLIVDAHCPACGFLNNDQQADGLFNMSLALEHTSAHGHVVILNGTTDIPIHEDLRPALTASFGADCSIP
jgi:hypothetical protein